MKLVMNFANKNNRTRSKQQNTLETTAHTQNNSTHSKQQHTLEKFDVYFEKAFLFKDTKCSSSWKCQSVSNFGRY
jgi:hypothetical protein